MSRSLKEITVQAGRLQMLAAPENLPVASNIREIHELGVAVNLAQRAIWSFALFVPRELVKRIVDNSISTELGGARQEITVVFTDVQGFTTIAESADPDALMHQTSRYFTALTEAFSPRESDRPVPSAIRRRCFGRAQQAVRSRRAGLSGSPCGKNGEREA